MPGARDAAAIIRGIHDRVQRLEDSVGTSEGIPVLIRQVRDQLSLTDTTDARESDASATDQVSAGDTASATADTSDAAWDQEDWDFAEWQ